MLISIVLVLNFAGVKAELGIKQTKISFNSEQNSESKEPPRQTPPAGVRPEDSPGQQAFFYYFCG